MSYTNVNESGYTNMSTNVNKNTTDPAESEKPPKPKKHKQKAVVYRTWKEPQWAEERLVKIPSPLVVALEKINPKREEFLRNNTRIMNRWTIKGKLGSISSHVYLAYDSKLRIDTAIKAYNSSETTLEKEDFLLKKIQHMQCTPEPIHTYLGPGPDSKPGFKFLVMTLLGPNLQTLIDTHGTFSALTTYLIGRQMLQCIDYLHCCGYVHRDIRPANFLVGLPPNDRRIFLVDLSQTRSYLTRERRHVVPRRRPGFRGTMAFASPAAHECRELSRRDDLWGLLLALLACRGPLPWTDQPHHGTVRQMKLRTVDGLIAERLGHLGPLKEHVARLDYFDEPDYELLQLGFNKAVRWERSCEYAAYEWVK